MRSAVRRCADIDILTAASGALPSSGEKFIE